MRANENQEKQFVDMRVPLSWLLTSAATIVFALGTTLWNVAGQTNKLDQLIQATTKLEKRMDERDAKTDDLRDRMFSMDRTTDNLKLRVEALERMRK